MSPFMIAHLIALCIFIPAVILTPIEYNLNIILVQIMVSISIISVQMFVGNRKFHTCKNCDRVRFLHWELESNEYPDLGLLICKKFVKKWWFQF